MKTPFMPKFSNLGETVYWFEIIILVKPKCGKECKYLIAHDHEVNLRD